MKNLIQSKKIMKLLLIIMLSLFTYTTSIADSVRRVPSEIRHKIVKKKSINFHFLTWQLTPNKEVHVKGINQWSQTRYKEYTWLFVTFISAKTEQPK